MYSDIEEFLINCRFLTAERLILSNIGETLEYSKPSDIKPMLIYGIHRMLFTLTLWLPGRGAYQDPDILV